MSDRRLSQWRLVYWDWNAEEQPLREALSTLGNGYFATRGAFEEASAGGPHYPGTYLAGGYDRLESEVSGRSIENEDLVNWPNWLPLSFRVEGGEWLDLDRVELIDYRQGLDILQGFLYRHLRFRDREGREFHLDTRRIVHMAHSHVAAIEWTLTPIDWSGWIEIRSGIDGRVTNSGVPRYRELNGQHLEVVGTHPSAGAEDTICLDARSLQSRIEMSQAVRTRCFSGRKPASVERRTEQQPGLIQQVIRTRCEANKPLRIEKVLALYTSRDHAISEPRLAACQEVVRLGDVAELLESHEIAWKHLWQRADVEIETDDVYPQFVLRLHIFHLLQVASFHAIDRDVGIPARGLHGEAYRGHIFWDELFIFPFLNLTVPEVTRALLMYRYRRLDEARHNAREQGFQGAMFPWQSGSDGREESQVVHLNPASGHWIPDNTHRQRHINAAIAYNIWQYVQATDDREFLSFYGAEMLLEIARFFASLATYNADRARYEIRGVVGPDEFHTQYPGTDSQGLDNNAYTNVMASWVLQTALATLDLLALDRRTELLEQLDLEVGELARWFDVSRRLFVPFQDGGIISQFEGWEDLEELDWEGLRERHGDIQRLDRILGAEHDDPNRYKATKQADVLMLFFLFSTDRLERLFRYMGYPFEGEMIPRNVEYYMARTSHGSTLSRVVHAWVLARGDRPRSWHLFLDALGSDIDDVQGGTTPEGIHLGAMAGTVDLIQRCYAGIEVHGDVLWFHPELPEELHELSFSVRYRGHWMDVRVTREQLHVAFRKGWSAPARIGFRGEIFDMGRGDARVFDLRQGAES